MFARVLDDVRVEDENLGVLVFCGRRRTVARGPRGNVTETNGHQLLTIEEPLIELRTLPIGRGHCSRPNQNKSLSRSRAATSLRLRITCRL